MDIEQRQAEHIEYFVKQASAVRGSALATVRELEDFLINECMDKGIVRGKLDQLRRCFEVQFAAGRDLSPGQLASLIETLSDW
nr:COP9 signalosome complex subunit 7 isoform X3 [Ipomoea batatas]